MLKNSLKGTNESFVASNNAYSFMSSVKGTPASLKQFFCNILTMVKQLGIPTYFLTLAYVDLRWEELLFVINKLNILGIFDKELENLSYQEWCNLLIKNPVFVA